MGVTREAGTEQPSDARMGTIGAHDMGDPQAGLAGGGLAAKRHAVAILRQPGQPVAPAEIDPGQLGEAPEQQLLDLGLVDVDEGREVVTGRARQPDLEQLAPAEIGAPQVPLHATLGDLLPDPQPRPDLERLALHAERLAPLAGVLRVLLQQEDRYSVLGQPAGQGHADRPGTDHGDLGVERACLGPPAAGRGHQAVSASQTARSRSTVQMRGWSIPSSSSQARCTLNGMVCSKIGKLP